MTTDTVSATERSNELVERHNVLANEHNELTARDSLTDGQQTRLDDITRAMAKNAAERADLATEVRQEWIAQVREDREAARPTFYDGTRRAPADDAHRLLDTEHRAGVIPSHAAERATELLDSGPIESRSIADRWVKASAAPAYRTAFAKLLADPVRGHMLWTTAEQAAYVAAHDVQRAMSSTGSAGGHLVPFTLDPAIMLTSAGSINPLRQLASVKQTTTDSWNGVTSAGVTAEWKAEADEVADASPTIAQAPIPVHFGDAFVPFSFEVGQDAVDLLGEVGELLSDAADQLQATAYTTGSGIGQPTGIITGLDGTSSEVAPTTAETFAVADVYKLQNALPARFSAGATWQSHLAFANTLRQFETTNGAHAFPSLHIDGSLLGRGWFENSNMDDSINPAATADNFVLLYGDIAKAFHIVDRVGSSVELIPNLVGENGRPTGQRGILLWFRTGSDVVNTAAARVLSIPTAA